MERATKLILIVSMGAALSVEALLVAREWPRVPVLTLAAFLIAAAASFKYDALPAALALGYVFPALFSAIDMRFETGYTVIWVWRDEDAVLTMTLHTTDPITQYIRIPDGRPSIVLETRVNRVMRPADFGLTDPRELGLMVSWDFMESHP